MVKKLSNIIFISLFFLMIAVPLVVTFFQHEEIAIEQNRMLEPFPHFKDEAGHLNPSFTMEFESWTNDHIGFRSFFANLNGRARYHLAGRFSVDRPMIFGPGGELNYAGEEAIRDYQHMNLYPDEYLAETAKSLQLMKDYAEEHGAEFYYYQCWDKPSIYPEYFPKEILQYGEESKTDGVINAFKEQTDVRVISSKPELINAKDTYETYSKWGDPTHWTHRGAYIGYRTLMNAINENAPQPYKILEEKDYNIKVTDQGLTLYGNIHQEDLLERFEISDPKAVMTREKLSLFSDDSRAVFYTNDEADNDTRLLIIGDSYFNYYILDDLAESFHEMVFLWGYHLNDFKEAVDAYQPDIVVIENAEREDRTSLIIEAAEKLK